MGAFLDKPKTDKTNESGKGNDLKYGLAAMQGWRIEMEDAHSSFIGLPMPGLEQWSFFAVFDGHAGGTVSKYLSKELINSILNSDPDLFSELASLYSSNQNNNETTNNTNITTSTSGEDSNSNNNTNSNSNTNNQDSRSNQSGENTNTAENNNNSSSSNVNNSVSNNVNNSNSNVNNSNHKNPFLFSQYSEAHEKRLFKAIRQGFLDLDDKIRQLPEFNRGEDKSGSTAVACLVSPSHVYLINCGDSRAIFVSDNQVVLGTYDHKPVNPNERERIENAGGSVMIQRVNGSLAVSRALGDYEYKNVEGRGPCEQLVSPEPEIYVCQRDERDEFLVLACDGIWDVNSNENIMDFARSRLKVTDDLVQISNDILDMSLNKVIFL
jgi:serine/threonine protein phosphatase PrpC